MENEKIGLKEYTKMRDDVLEIPISTGAEALFEQKCALDDFKLYKDHRNKLMASDFYIAILGEQGVGKSSLINAILFNERILPIDVDETTNVITKVRSSADDGEKCIIIFKSGSKEVGPVKSDFLRQYVDNEINPKNEKGVAEAIVHHKHSLLREGVVFADTPGPGSLTPENFQQTFDFLPKISAGILIFRTTPPLGESEIRDVIEKTWEHSQYYFFVQNKWSESQKNFEDSLKHNLRVLNEIKEKHQSNVPIRIFPVDIHKAVEGACNNNDNLLKESGIQDLTYSLFAFLNQDIGKLRVFSFLLFLKMKSTRIMENLIAEEVNINSTMQMQKQEFESQMKQKREDIESIRNESFERNRNFIRKTHELINDFSDSIQSKLNSIGEDIKSQVRRRRANAKRIQQNFQDKIKREIPPLVKSFSLRYEQLLREFIELYMKLGEKVKATIVTGKISNEAIQQLKPLEITEKFGKILQYGGSTALSIIGISAIAAGIKAALAAAATAAAPLAASAGAAAAIAVVPVWGWIAAGVVLLGGIAVTKISKDKIIKKLENSVDKAVVEIKKQFKTAIHSKLEQNCNDVIEQLDDALKSEINFAEKELDIMKEDYYSSKEKKQIRISQISDQKKVLTELFIGLDSFSKKYKLAETYEK